MAARIWLLVRDETGMTTGADRVVATDSRAASTGATLADAWTF